MSTRLQIVSNLLTDSTENNRPPVDLGWRSGHPFTATEQHVTAPWSGGENGKYFRCGLCGHRFQVGDVVRWVYMNSTSGSLFGNFLTCQACDGPDIVERRLAWQEEAKNRFWQLFRDMELG